MLIQGRELVRVRYLCSSSIRGCLFSRFDELKLAPLIKQALSASAPGGSPVARKTRRVESAGFQSVSSRHAIRDPRREQHRGIRLKIPPPAAGVNRRAAP